jgi:CHAD domain-containing protein
MADKSAMVLTATREGAFHEARVAGRAFLKRSTALSAPRCRTGTQPQPSRARLVSWLPHTWRRSAMCLPATTSECAPVRQRSTRPVWRLRTTLRIFADVVDAGPAQELDNELKWYADLLGQVRDRDVLSSRLINQIADLPPEHVRGLVGAEITKTLDSELEDAVRRLDRAIRTQRYKHLMQLLRGWRATPPLTDTASQDGAEAVKHVETAQRKADKRLRKADDDIEQLHQAQKAFKRARYAAELVEPADSQMKAIARNAQEMQTFLGEHQDAVVTAKFLAATSADKDIEAGSAFTYGVLIANELNRAAEIRASLRN